MKSFWFTLALRLVHTALGLLIDHRAAKQVAASSDSSAAPVEPATAAPGAGI